MEMSHRQRARAVLSGERPDRPVFDMGGRVASLSIPPYLTLKAHLGFEEELDGEQITILNTIGEIDERVLQSLDIPFRRLYLRPAASFQMEIAPDGTFLDEWGVGRQQVGPYNERISYPLANATIHDVQNFAWPDPFDPGRCEGLADEARRMYEKTDFCLVAGHISAGIFQDCWNLRGMEQFLLDMIENRELAEALLDKVTAIHIDLWAVFLNAVGEYVDMVETADDLGGQMGLLISREMYRDLIKPRHVMLHAAFREHTTAKILFHSCGAIMPLIDDLIETGVQVLNPIQPLPGRMDPEEMRKCYGDQLVFHGGLDVQDLLLNGSPADVIRHVRHYYAELGLHRYIMAPANSVQPGTPPENLLAAYQAAREQ
jgi:uroporphyrinogen decarboxylase